MRRAAILVLFLLVAAALVTAQTPAGSNNTPSNTPQTQNPAVPSNPAAQSPETKPSDLPQGDASQPPNPTAIIDEVGTGTEIHAALDTPLSTRVSKAGDRFTATVSEAVRANTGAIVIPAGARVEGEVEDAEEGKLVGTVRGKGKLSLRFRDVVLPSGQTLPLTATLTSVHDTSGKNINKKTGNDSSLQSGMRNQNIARGTGGDSSSGNGLVFGGPIKGLAIGALAGGGYVVSTKSKDVNLPAQAGMVIRVDQPLSWNGTTSPLNR